MGVTYSCMINWTEKQAIKKEITSIKFFASHSKATLYVMPRVVRLSICLPAMA